MGRPQRKVDPEAGPLQHFAHDLRALRAAAGAPSYRRLAGLANYSATALSEAAGGEQLPTLAVTLAYAGACGGDVDEWRARWQAVAAELAAPAPPDGDAAAPPYLGLRPFQPEHAGLFFGRARLVAEVVARLADRPFLAVFGASGSGKSSLLRAGVLPALTVGAAPGGGDQPAVLLTPGERPLEELAVALATPQGVPVGALLASLRADPATAGLAVRQALVARPPGTRLLLVVDQFEELFTACREPEERAAFVTALAGVVEAAGECARVVVAVRADLYGRCADHPALLALVQDAQVLVGPMAPDELREVVTRPAAAAGLAVEPALVATVLADVGDEPGSLPLLSHALLETWRRRRGDRLTLAGYQATGTVRGAIAQTAQALYDDLSPAHQAIARAVFLRLTAVGEGTEDTGRRVRRADLPAGDDPEGVALVLDRLAAARLVTVDEHGVQVAHAALVRAWPALRAWVDEDREGLRTHRQLTEAAHAWLALDRDLGALYRGARLAVARAWADGHGPALNDLEREFLNAGARRERDELQAARRRSARLAAMAAVLAALLVLAVQQRQVLREQRDVATARQLVAESEAAAGRDPRLAALLTLAAGDLADIPETRSGALAAWQQVRHVQAFLEGHRDRVGDVAFSPDGGTVASASGDGTVILWDAARRTRQAELTAPELAAGVTDVTFRPGGRTLATGGEDGSVVLWDVARRAPLATLGSHEGAVTGVAFSPDGRTVATGGRDGVVVLWDVEARRRTAALPAQAGPVRDLAFSPDGAALASGSGRDVLLWDVAGRAQVAALSGHGDEVRGVAFSPDGAALASTGFGGEIILWDVAGRTPAARLPGSADAVFSPAFSPDGRVLATAGSDRTVVLWDVGRRARITTVTGHADQVLGVAFSPDGRTLASAGLDGTVLLSDAAPATLSGHAGSVFAVAFDPHGRFLATGSEDATVVLWDVARRRPRTVLPANDWVLGLAVSPDGRTLAGTQLDGSATLWDTGGGAPLATLPPRSDWVPGAAFSPDGRVLALGTYDSDDDRDGEVLLWDVERRRPRATLISPSVASGVADVAFSPDGATLASADAEGTVTLWDVRGERAVATLREHRDELRSVAFSPDGRTLAGGDRSGRVVLWDVARRTALATLDGHADEAYDLAFSPDGATLASAGLDGRLVLWDVAARTARATLTPGADGVHSVAFSPDGRRLAVGQDGRDVALWDVDVAAVRRRLCAVAGRELTAEEWAAHLGDRPRRAVCTPAPPD